VDPEVETDQPVGSARQFRSAEEAILIAANIRGDSDSVASIAGGILGAAYRFTSWCDSISVCLPIASPIAMPWKQPTMRSSTVTCV